MMDDSEFCCDWVKHEDQNVINRGNFFLVAESMLFAGAGALLAGNPRDPDALRFFSVAGVLITGVWLWVSLFHVFGTQRELKRKWRIVDSRVSDLKQHTYRLVGNHVVLGLLLPLGLSVMWILFWLWWG